MKKTDKGVSLLEVLLVIGIMVMVIPKVYENIENHHLPARGFLRHGIG